MGAQRFAAVPFVVAGPPLVTRQNFERSCTKHFSNIQNKLAFCLWYPESAVDYAPSSLIVFTRSSRVYMLADEGVRGNLQHLIVVARAWGKEHGRRTEGSLLSIRSSLSRLSVRSAVITTHDGSWTAGTWQVGRSSDWECHQRGASFLGRFLSFQWACIRLRALCSYQHGKAVGMEMFLFGIARCCAPTLHSWL